MKIGYKGSEKINTNQINLQNYGKVFKKTLGKRLRN